MVDIDGYIVHDHAGEGEYDKTEKAIQDALAERASRLKMDESVATSTVELAIPDLSAVLSQETYFGSDRNEYLGNGVRGISGSQDITIPSSVNINSLYLGGNWNITPEYAESNSGGQIVFKYSAHYVYIVAANKDTSVKIKILRDGQPVGDFAGSDVDPKTSEATINGDRLYRLIHDTSPGVHTIEIQIEGGTLDAYTFTFG